MANGLPLDTLGTVLYFCVVGLFSMVVAYFVVFKAFGYSGKRGTAHDSSPHFIPHTAPAAHAPHAIPIEATHAKPFRGFSPYEGFKSFAQGSTVTIDDIVKGLARESGAAAIHESHEAENIEHVHEHAGLPETSAQTSEFLRAMVNGDRETTFEILRNVEELGEGAEPFMKRVLTALESALESRLHGKVCDITVLDILGSCDTPVIEKLIEALGTAQGKHGPKLALTRAFSALQQ